MANSSVISIFLLFLFGWQLICSVAFSENGALPSNFDPIHPFNLLSTSTGQDYTCSKTKPCQTGCCGPLDSTGTGNCGFGPDFCGPKCTSDCDRKSECDPGWGKEWANSSTCPLNVCCSRFGFCGTTRDFCGNAVVVSPQCSGASARERTIGYYEAWNIERPCGKMGPDDIPLGYYTHLNYAFALIDPTTFRIAAMDNTTGSLYQSVTALRKRQVNLEVWIAIGGWAMNDPGPTRTVFSDLAASPAAQDTFFESLISFMLTNGFDGVDLDWEYPMADDRGGKPQDFGNFVTLLKRLRERLNQTGRQFGVSITLPASYWYLRGFDIVNLEPHVDFFNMMTYDIHGLWDATNKELGPYAFAHTNLTEINAAIELLWRNNINPARVNLGLGFYGRSFTMKNPSCLKPGCPFSAGARAGECTGTPGVLAAYEIDQIIRKGNANVTLYKDEAVTVVTWDNDQWVSMDNKETLKLKVDYANKRCLGGTMVWAIDLDDGTLIGDLGEATGKNRSRVFPRRMALTPDLGTTDVDDLLGWKKWRKEHGHTHGH
ncbi:glycoside hydrolase [Aspergillus sclerotioniger CBS 115572]|uniref:chitinase n=1 Tax=Aspergillus sclerotioniger CBS 115572 TaxID=1450535 RepID=A0A317VF45_9EURO|nr:glycoside hydrolase [Aspergillus sclerotioniger CBS 115572]PWY71578.1 glycoside hydrolase [Aspergillus sclerotioniger CBS 115572]